MSKGKQQLICLVCLRKFPEAVKENEEGYQQRLLALSAAPHGGRETYDRFLLWTQRFLKLEELGHRFQYLGRLWREQHEGQKLPAFCERCQLLVAYLCDLYAELETVRLHLNRKLTELERTMRVATKKISQKLQRGIMKAVGEQVNASGRQAEIFRRAVIISCGRKLKHVPPRITVPKGLFPEEWKFTYKATHESVMLLIVVFALASPPRPKKPTEEENYMKGRSIAKRKIGPRSRMEKGMGFGDIARDLMVKKEEEEPLASYFEAGDDDDGGAFPDTGNDNDSDWSRGGASAAASPASSPDEDGDDTQDLAPRKRLRLRKTRQRFNIKKEGEEDSENEENDPEFKMNIPKRSRKMKHSSEKIVKEATISCKRCSQMFIDNRGLAKHMKLIHKTRLTYTCPHCGMKCNSSMELTAHKLRLHREKLSRGRGTGSSSSSRPNNKAATLPCPHCDRMFIDRRGLAKHMNKMHKTHIEYVCTICGHVSKSQADKMAHRSKMHRQRRGRRPRTGVGCLESQLNKHCKACDRKFESREAYLTHKREAHNKLMRIHRLQCPVCARYFGQDATFKEHLCEHEQESGVLKPYHCGACGATFFDEDELQTHFMTEHEGAYKCEQCGSSHSSSKFLREHLEIHETAEKRFWCNFCYRGYTHRQYWAIHRKVAHVGNERMFCEEDKCPLEFNTVEELSEHMKTHLADESEAQEATTTEEKTEANDIVSKEPMKLFTCTTCSWPFLSSSRLELHSLHHIPNNSGYKCPHEYCYKTFILKDRLITHYCLKHFKGPNEEMLSYERECHICPQKFNSFLLYKIHLKLHEERNSGRQFVCDICGDENVDSIALNAHRLHKHLKKVKVEETEEGAKAVLLNPLGEPVHFRKPGRPRGLPRTDTESRMKKIEAQRRRKRELQEKWSQTPCEVCEKVFEDGTPGDLRKHLETQHEDQVPEEEKTRQCHFCHLKFKWAQSLELHGIIMHMQLHRFTCDATGCDGRYDSFEELSEHLKKVHLLQEGEELTEETTSKVVKVKEFCTCTMCGWQFVSPNYLDLHLLNHVVPSDHLQYPCPTCDSRYPSVTALKGHWNTKHGLNLRPYACTLCPARFFMPHGLRNHIKRHETNKVVCDDTKLVCVECNKTFRDFQRFEMHRKAHDPRNHLVCPEGCGEVLRDKERLTNHLRKVHGHGERHPCHICGLTYSYTWELKKHITWSHGPARYECDICGQKYKRPSGLSRHKKRHSLNPETGETGPQYVCAECGNQYKSEEGLKYHVASIHTAEKRFACPHCPYKTHRKMLMKMHLKSCLRQKGLPWDEEKWGKIPEPQPHWTPGRVKTTSKRRGFNNPTGRPRRRNQELEEMEEKSTTEEEEEEEQEDRKEEAPPILYPQQQPSTSSSSSNINVINAILANITGIPDLTSQPSQEESPNNKRGRGRPKRASTTTTTSSEQPLYSSPAVAPSHPQLFGNNHGPQFQSWVAPTPGAYQQFQFPQQQQQGNRDDLKPEFSGSLHNLPPHLQPQQPHIAYSPPEQHGYSPSPPPLVQQQPPHGSMHYRK